jgi:hypothetical protein
MKRNIQSSYTSSNSNEESIIYDLDSHEPTTDEPITKPKMKRTRPISISSSDSNEEPTRRNCKKRKLEDNQTPYFLMTTDEDIIMFYEIDTTHKLFPIVINALKTNKIEEKDNYHHHNEIALFDIMIEYASWALWNDGSRMVILDEFYQLSRDSKKAIQNFLGIHNFKESDFTRFLKSKQEGIDLAMQRTLLSSHVVFLQSC